MEKKTEVKAVSNSEHFLILKLNASNKLVEILTKIKQQIYRDDDYVLTILEKEKNKKYPDYVNSDEGLGEDAHIFYFPDYASVVIAKSSDRFDEIRDMFMSVKE